MSIVTGWRVVLCGCAEIVRIHVDVKLGAVSLFVYDHVRASHVCVWSNYFRYFPWLSAGLISALALRCHRRTKSARTRSHCKTHPIYIFWNFISSYFWTMFNLIKFFRFKCPPTQAHTSLTHSLTAYSIACHWISSGVSVHAMVTRGFPHVCTLCVRIGNLRCVYVCVCFCHLDTRDNAGDITCMIHWFYIIIHSNNPNNRL